MPWFKISDDWATHPKTIAAGKNPRLLWVCTGTLMAKSSTDGVIAKDQQQLYAALAGVPWASNSKKLIEVGFWHPAGDARKCRDCATDIDAINHHRREEDMPLLELNNSDLYWHAWAAHQLPKHRQMSPEAKAADDRSRALRKDAQLCQEIQKRDRSLCRYCGRRVDWRDRRSTRRATYDHLDPYCYSPAGGNFLEAIVTACGDCNGKKGKRTAAEWAADGGLTLKPVGWAAGDPELDPSGSDPDLARIKSGSNPFLIPDPGFSSSGSNPTRAHGRPHPRLGPGQVGLDPGLDPGRPGVGRVGLAGAGAGLGLAGLVRPGEGREPQPAPNLEPPPPDRADGDPAASPDVTVPATPGGPT